MMKLRFRMKDFRFGTVYEILRNFLKWGRIVMPQKYPRIFIIILLYILGMN